MDVVEGREKGVVSGMVGIWEVVSEDVFCGMGE